jgi:mRNA-degrading endonuclease RelE of RelBE toxin-antitoxin system
MPNIETTDHFEEAFCKLPADIRRKVIIALRYLAENPRHPSLRTKAVKGAPGIYEARLYKNYRMTYERLPGDALRLRVVARHNEALKKP